MWWRNYCKTSFLKCQNFFFLSIAKGFMQLAFIVCQAEHYRRILKLSCRPLDFISYYAFLGNKKRSGTIFPALLSE